MSKSRRPDKDFLKMCENHRGNVWFISDTHFGHLNILFHTNRDFVNINKHDKFIINEWNKVISDEDLVFHLGDVSFLSDSKTINILNKLKGIKVLIKGNHDKSHRKMIELGFDYSFTSCSYGEYLMKHNRHKISSNEYDRQVLLVGHTHEKEKILYVPHLDVCCVNLCMDAWDYKPVSIDDLNELVKREFRSLI